MRSRGLDVEVPGRLGDLNREDLSFEWSPAPPVRPTNREASVDEITRILSQAEVTDTPFLMSAQLQSDQRGAESVSVRGVDDYVEFQLVSETWWMDRAVETRDNASLIAARLLSFAVQVTGLPTDASPDAVPLREVLAQIGDHAVRLGWDRSPWTRRSGIGDRGYATGLSGLFPNRGPGRRGPYCSCWAIRELACE